jgi:hypothetical protein
MKRNLLTVCIIFFALNSQAQLDTIPNASFENWYYLPNNTVQATGWHDNNSSIAAWNVMPDSISVTGALSLELNYVSYRGIIWSGFPIANHPLSLDGYMKNYLNLGDTALISIHVYNSNTLVDSGHAEIYGGIATVFLPFTVNITQNASVADSCVITLTGGNMSGSISWFDDLSFTFPTAIRENYFNTEWMIFPNPCHYDAITIVGAYGIIENSILTLYDARGRIIREEKIPLWLGRYPLNISSLPAGAYLLGITDKEKRINRCIIKN